MRNPIFLSAVLAILPTTALADTNDPQTANKKAADLTVTSTAFTNNQAIPSEYTCEGTNISPPLQWSNVPAKTKSVAVLVEDPDAPKGTFTHWLVTGISPSATSLPSLGKEANLPGNALAMTNDSGKPGYTGPCPPAGMHHYHFRVYALDITLPMVITREEMMNTIKGHVLATGDLVGTYEKHELR